MRVLVIGLAVTGEAVVRHRLLAGDEVMVLEDRPGANPHWDDRARRAADAGVEVVASPSAEHSAALGAAADLVVPSPGVPERHPAIAGARRHGTPVRSEIDLAADVRNGPAIVAVTGTNGKTTVTTLAAAMLGAAGLRATAAGNIGRPLIDAVHDDVDVVVAEVSSFQLAFTERFAPRAAALLNLGADHLDWHRTFDAYARAKANVFLRQHPDDVLVFNADDPVVAGLTAGAPARRVPFSVASGAAEGARLVDTVRGRLLVGPSGQELARVEELAGARPVDLANGLAASALALDLGATAEGVREALASFRGLPHRMQVVADHDGICWVDDSKATNVHATLAAVGGLDHVVLLAGGRNKGLDLRDLRVLAPRLRAVVAIGDAAGEVEDAFDGVVPVVRASSMQRAVAAASELARRGDTVLLSPACASFDWYASYGARGDDFAAEVRAIVEVQR
ncbi:MAG TPA: UDP-N-acetylmuramoyl-L-alanine--D-glutamate ligase [Acidimicrobiia bacterium]|jgi:UDP-N-acetylmuramoylalanine--D-glutamate ligase